MKTRTANMMYMVTSLVAILSVGAVVSANSYPMSSPKYVFFFLGDGMANAQIQATEAYLTTVHGGSATKADDLLLPRNRLNMTKLPVQGMQTTYDSFSLITDSASAGTAFACGLKTESGVIGMDNTKTISYKSVAELAFEQGRKVGIITSVSLDHATPASYYASVANRGYMNNIATQLALTGYNFFGGGGFASPTAAARSGDTSNNIWDLLSAADNLLYGTYEPIIVTITHILSEVAGIGWTSYVHTGVPVPVYAAGKEAWRFAGFYDNTDIAKQIAKVMNIRTALPIEK